MTHQLYSGFNYALLRNFIKYQVFAVALLVFYLWKCAAYPGALHKRIAFSFLSVALGSINKYIPKVWGTSVSNGILLYLGRDRSVYGIRELF